MDRQPEPGDTPDTSLWAERPDPGPFTPPPAWRDLDRPRWHRSPVCTAHTGLHRRMRDLFDTRWTDPTTNPALSPHETVWPHPAMRRMLDARGLELDPQDTTWPTRLEPCPRCGQGQPVDR